MFLQSYMQEMDTKNDSASNVDSIQEAFSGSNKHKFPSISNELEISTSEYEQMVMTTNTLNSINHNDNCLEASDGQNQNQNSHKRLLQNIVSKKLPTYRRPPSNYTVRPQFVGKYTPLKERNLPYPGGINPMHPKACLDRLLFRMNKEKSRFDFEYILNEDCYVVTYNKDGKVVSAKDKELHIASDRCAEKAFVLLIGKITNQGKQPKEKRIYSAMNLIAELIASMSLYKLLQSWYEPEEKLPERFWVGSQMRGPENILKNLGEKLKRQAMEDGNGNDNLKQCTIGKETKAKEESHNSLDYSNEKDTTIPKICDDNKRERIPVQPLNFGMEEVLTKAKPSIDVNIQPRKLINSDYRYITVQQQNKMLQNLHGKIKFKKVQSGVAPTVNYKATSVVNELSFIANGSTYRAARQRCVLAILKSCDNIDIKFSPRFRLREILKGKLDWLCSKKRYNKNREDSKLRHRATLMLNGKAYRGQGCNINVAKNNCAHKVLREVYNIDEY